MSIYRISAMLYQLSSRSTKGMTHIHFQNLVSLAAPEVQHGWTRICECTTLFLGSQRWPRQGENQEEDNAHTPGNLILEYARHYSVSAVVLARTSKPMAHDMSKKNRLI